MTILNRMLRHDAQRAVLWMKVGTFSADAHPACETCSHLALEVDHEPYQEGTAPIVYEECTLGQRCHDEPTQCPALQQQLAEDADEAPDSLCLATYQ